MGHLELVQALFNPSSFSYWAKCIGLTQAMDLEVRLAKSI